MNLTGALLCTAGMIVLGSSVAISRLVLDYPTLTGQTLRYAVAAALLAALVRYVPWLNDGHRPVRHRRLTRQDWTLLAALAASGLVAFNICVLTALRHADAATVGTVVGAAPLALALLGPLLRGVRPAGRLVLAAGIVVAGTAAVHGSGTADALGLVACFGALAGEVAFSLFAAVLLDRLGAVRVSAYSCGLAVPMFALAALVAGEADRWRLPTAAEATALAYLAVMLTVVAFLAWFTGLRRLGVERAGMFIGVLPATALASAALLDQVPPSAGQSVGVLIVAAGLAIGMSWKPPVRDPSRQVVDAAPVEPEHQHGVRYG
ncbi:DMT family transporter [Micromonospora sp. LOL_021]|uniref:DMT family transporter n=1 Tax=Micromonospora sp. LOL_021 TaxID=3345417 RepID=UPI003A88935D